MLEQDSGITIYVSVLILDSYIICRNFKAACFLITINLSTYIYCIKTPSIRHENQCITPHSEVDLLFNTRSLTSTMHSVKQTILLNTCNPRKNIDLRKKHKKPRLHRNLWNKSSASTATFDTLINQLSQTKHKTNETGHPLKTMRRKTGGILTRQSVTEKGVNCRC